MLKKIALLLLLKNCFTTFTYRIAIKAVGEEGG